MKAVDNLFNTLKSRGYTQKDVAEKIGTSKQNIGRIISNGDMKVSQFHEICESFQISANDLMLQEVIYVDPLADREESILVKLERERAKVTELTAEIEKCKGQASAIEYLENTIKDKNDIIELLKSKNS